MEAEDEFHNDAELDINEEDLGDEDIDVANEYPITDDSIKKLCRHSSNVVFLSLSLSGRWLVSGSEDDTALLWDLNSSDYTAPVMTIRHIETVNAIAFNNDPCEVVATGDMSGMIICTDVDQKDKRLTIQESEQVEWLLWHHSANILFAGCTDGSIWMWLINQSFDTVLQSKIYAATNFSSINGTLLADHKSLLSIYENGQIKLWCLKSGNSDTLQLKTSCSSLDVHGNIAAVGALDGTTTLVALSPFKITSTLGESLDDLSNSVEVVKFCDAFNWLAIGTAGGSLAIYEWENGTLRHSCDHDGMAVVSCSWIASESSLYISSACIDGCIRLWDAKTGSPIKIFSGGGDEIYYMKSLQREAKHHFFFTGCSGGNIRIFDVEVE